MRDYLCRLPDQTPSDRLYKKDLLAKALNPAGGLGNFFYIQRGLRKPHPSRGTLSRIQKKYANILIAETREEIELESKVEASESTAILITYKERTARRHSFRPQPSKGYGSFNHDDADSCPEDSKSIFDYKR